IQTNILRPNNGASVAKPPINKMAFDGVLYFGCNLPKKAGNICALDIAYSRRLPPIKKAFQLDKIPSTPPITNKIPAHLPCHALVMASAVARVELSACTSGKVVPTLHAIPTYHITATIIE